MSTQHLLLNQLLGGREVTIVNDNAHRPAYSCSERVVRQRRRQTGNSPPSSRWEMPLSTAPKSPGRIRRRIRSPSPQPQGCHRDQSPETDAPLLESLALHLRNCASPNRSLSDLYPCPKELPNTSTKEPIGSSSLHSYLQPHGISKNSCNASLSSSHSSLCRWTSKSTSAASFLSASSPRPLAQLTSSSSDECSDGSLHLSRETISRPETARGQAPKKPVRRRSFAEEKEKHKFTTKVLNQAITATQSM